MIGVQFYPTPETLLENIDINCKDKVVLEPSAGKGDIVNHLYQRGANKVLTCEIDPVLAEYLKGQSQFIRPDFMQVTSEELSHINMIVMNPPFSKAESHIIHAWKVAPEGTEIIAICNAETLKKNYRYRELASIVENYGVYEYQSNAFSESERKTDVEIAILRLFKPIISQENDRWEGFFETEDIQPDQSEGIVKFNELQAMVNTYVSAVRFFDQVHEDLARLNLVTDGYGMKLQGFTVSSNETVVTKEHYARELQKSMWKKIFKYMNLDKYVTAGVRKDINAFVEQQTKYPFSLRNIYRMLEIIIGTREENFNRAVVEAIDNFTRYTHENRFGVEGWKTNAGHMLNKKFIVNYMSEKIDGGGLKIKTWNSNYHYIEDLTKVMCNLTGVDYNTIKSISYAACNWNEDGYLTKKGERVKSHIGTGYQDRIIGYDKLSPNTWYDWGFFEFKVFKKGTMHLKFKDTEQWYLLNQKYGQIKGFNLPETYKK